ncbi:Gfo/Idh/MocA family oxidoreductase [Morganella morganii]|nr:Gfo/Idh/MocA family oxidoreductase [Morganella morganii]
MQKIAVIGLGNISSRHRQNLKKLFPDSILFAMSASGRRPEEPIENADIICTSIEELIKQGIELAIIASPASLHAQHAIPLIKANIPILIEKPISSILSDAELIKNKTTEYNTPVAIGYCLRYLSSAKKIKEYLDDKIIGNIYHVNIEVGQYLPDWRPNKDYLTSVSANKCLGGGALLELSHELDYARWLFGPLTLNHAILRTSDELNLNVEDSVDLLASTKKNAVIHIHLDFLQRKAQRICRIVGSKGALDWNLITNEIYFHYLTDSLLLYSEPTWDKNLMYISMLTDFIAKINSEENQVADISDSVETIRFIEDIKNSYPN